jgi:hypothetical protein
MVSNISQIVRHLFEKDTLEEVPESELRYFIRQYPYSGTGHLLLARKLQLSGEKRAFDREVAVTSVYFANPAWLQFLFYAPGGEDLPPAPPHPADIEKEIEGPDELDLEQTEVEDQEVQPADEPVVVPPDELHNADDDPEDQAETTPSTGEPVNQSFFISNITDTAPAAVAGASVGDESSHAGVGTVLQNAGITTFKQDVDEEEVPNSKVGQAGTNAATEAAETADESKLDFDPYHTIDYFASQGIKLRMEDFSKDKLGQQLKSFTEWIRSMKRLPQQEVDGSVDETDQHAVRRIAEHSVEEKEVLTEAMAEVWAKQGNREKARQIYIKLSLQNPSKSSYFAAKIDQLTIS